MIVDILAALGNAGVGATAYTVARGPNGGYVLQYFVALAFGAFAVMTAARIL